MLTTPLALPLYMYASTNKPRIDHLQFSPEYFDHPTWGMVRTAWHTYPPPRRASHGASLEHVNHAEDALGRGGSDATSEEDGCIDRALRKPPNGRVTKLPDGSRWAHRNRHDQMEQGAARNVGSNAEA